MLSVYLDQRESQGISENTMELERSCIESFYSFLNLKYQKKIEFHEVRPIDVHDYLNRESEHNSDGTILRKISILRNWFDFLWRENQIPVDFMAKFKYHRKLAKNVLNPSFSYEQLLDKKMYILKSDLSLTAKVVFLLLLRGVRIREIQEIKLIDFFDSEEQIKIVINRESEKEYTVSFDQQQDMHVLLDAKAQAIFRGVPYLLSTKRTGETNYSRFRSSSVKAMLDAIEIRLGMPFKAETVRKSYLIYLATVMNYTTDDFVNMLGFRWEAAAAFKKYLKEIEVKDSEIL